MGAHQESPTVQSSDPLPGGTSNTPSRIESFLHIFSGSGATSEQQTEKPSLEKASVNAASLAPAQTTAEPIRRLHVRSASTSVITRFMPWKEPEQSRPLAGNESQNDDNDDGDADSEASDADEPAGSSSRQRIPRRHGYHRQRESKLNGVPASPGHIPAFSIRRKGKNNYPNATGKGLTAYHSDGENGTTGLAHTDKGHRTDGETYSTRRRIISKIQKFSSRKPKGKENALIEPEPLQDDLAARQGKELVNELSLPDVPLHLLSSMFLRDEKGHRRIPALLDQVRLKFRGPTKREAAAANGAKYYYIDLEYGHDATLMKWTIQRTNEDFEKLNDRYRLQEYFAKYYTLWTEGLRDGVSSSKPNDPNAHLSSEGRLRQIFNSWRTFSGENDGGEGADGVDGEPANNEDDPTQLVEATDAEASGAERLTTARDADTPNVKLGGHRNSQYPAITSPRRAATAIPAQAQTDGAITEPSPFVGPSRPSLPHIRDNRIKRKKQASIERKRRQLEQYLFELLAFFRMSPDGNRLCKFLELSALGIRLAAEGGYHGKEGFMVIQSYKAHDFRAVWNLRGFTERHAPKWFLVRESYIVCVKSPEDLDVYDVILVDHTFSMKEKIANPTKNSSAIEDEKPSTDGVSPDDLQGAEAQAPNEAKAGPVTEKSNTPYASHHLLRIKNSENKIRLLARNDRQLHQFKASIRYMLENTDWHHTNRFKSFAPVREKVYAQFLVDGRDYMWNVSQAIMMAKDIIYIHDWWLSPELYMRRPAEVNEKWRLDRLLQHKANEGVKVFVIVYHNLQLFVPIDSEHTKKSLRKLSPNVFVMRSPSQNKPHYWAHHEKLVVVDNMVAFCGGIDLAFGRWDSPDHVVCDDKPLGQNGGDNMPLDVDHCRVWPGKDYSNARVKDFEMLDKPEDELYDRTRVPRMPWHDVGMQMVGQPARDIARHFVQRWNYLARYRKRNYPTPFLLPPPDFRPGELDELGLTGTCEVQVIRSAGSWSLGLRETEKSIEDAYVTLIETSEHFVYIENQFFITSTKVAGKKIKNRIGDALVKRILRAHEENSRSEGGKPWRAIILIPLMPGFEGEVDDEKGGNLRRIIQCQYQSICRGPGRGKSGEVDSSIFGRLEAADIDPLDYISFYGLRNWGKIGPNKALVTEQLYIHAKVLIVDDRAAIIGSANINERSMIGDRDSEVGIVVRDTDTISSYMGGKPYMVGRFPHTLRMRLMREHLGLDVDAIADQESAQKRAEAHAPEMGDLGNGHRVMTSVDEALRSNYPHFPSVNNTITDPIISIMHDGVAGQSNANWNPSDSSQDEESAMEGIRKGLRKRAKRIREKGKEKVTDNELDGNKHLKVPAGTDNQGPADPVDTTDGAATNANIDTHNEGRRSVSPAPRPTSTTKMKDENARDRAAPEQTNGVRDFVMKTKSAQDFLSTMPPTPTLTDDCMQDPIHDDFFHGIWDLVSRNNTNIYRKVFRCLPDSEVRSWSALQEYIIFQNRLKAAQGLLSKDKPSSSQRPKSANERAAHSGSSGRPDPASQDQPPPSRGDKPDREGLHPDTVNGTGAPSGNVNMVKHQPAADVDRVQATGSSKEGPQRPAGTGTTAEPSVPPTAPQAAASRLQPAPWRRRLRSRQFQGDGEEIDLEVSRLLLNNVQGHLVDWPYDFISTEGWVIEQLAPLDIFS